MTRRINAREVLRLLDAGMPRNRIARTQVVSKPASKRSWRRVRLPASAGPRQRGCRMRRYALPPRVSCSTSGCSAARRALPGTLAKAHGSVLERVMHLVPPEGLVHETRGRRPCRRYYGPRRPRICLGGNGRYEHAGEARVRIEITGAVWR